MSLFQKFLKNDKDLESCARCFLTPGETCESIEIAGCKAMVLLFGGKLSDNLSTLQHNLLKKKVVSATSFVSLEQLLPTALTTKFHSLRVYYQIMTWLGKDNSLEATNWGWQCDHNEYQPVMCDKAPAPDSLLKIVLCNCKTACSSSRCTCQHYGLPCTSDCGQCQTVSCENPFNQSANSDADHDDTDDSDL